MQRVIVDMDEVIADPMGAMIEYYTQKYGGPVNYENMTGGSWMKGFPEEYRVLLRNHLESPGFFRNLPVIKNSVEVLKEINQRYELFIVSAALEFPNSLKDKYEWLQEHFPFLSWRQLTLCGDKRLITGDYMIDDHTRNLEHFSGKKYLYTSAHNRDVTGYDRINNWEEAAAIFL